MKLLTDRGHRRATDVRPSLETQRDVHMVNILLTIQLHRAASRGRTRGVLSEVHVILTDCNTHAEATRRCFEGQLSCVLVIFNAVWLRYC